MDNATALWQAEGNDTVTDNKLDHLVVAAESLEAGREHIEDVLGVATQPGGRHEAMGTHNRLLRLGEDQYLEIIAVDPEGAPPQRPRWFALDEPDMQSRLRSSPMLVTWVARTDAIEQTAARSPYAGYEIGDMQRGDLRWRMTFTPAGGLVDDGVLPLLIEWQAGGMPPHRLPESGCALERLTLRSPRAADVEQTLKALGLEDVDVEQAAQAGLVAVISTPTRGEVILSSPLSSGGPGS